MLCDIVRKTDWMALPFIVQRHADPNTEHIKKIKIKNKERKKIEPQFQTIWTLCIMSSTECTGL